MLWLSDHGEWYDDITIIYDCKFDALRTVNETTSLPGKLKIQCFDFGNTLVALMRSAGIASKAITGINPDGWSFHVWAEMYNGTTWKAIDPTSDDFSNAHTPTTDMNRDQDATGRKQYWTNTGWPIGGRIIYYDPNIKGEREVTDNYQDPLAPEKLQISTSCQSLISINVSKPSYIFGENVNLQVTVTNSGASQEAFDINFLAENEPSTSAIIQKHGFNGIMNSTQPIVVEPFSTAAMNYSITPAAYMENGVLYLIASALGTSGSCAGATVSDTESAPVISGLNI